MIRYRFRCAGIKLKIMPKMGIDIVLYDKFGALLFKILYNQKYYGYCKINEACWEIRFYG